MNLKSNIMNEINIEINIEEDKWLQEQPNSEEIISKSCTLALQAVGIFEYAENIEISVLLTNDGFIQGLNRDYRGKDKPTNVLSFPQEEFIAGNYADIEGQIALGDVIFAFETINNEAIEQEKSFENHLAHLAVHGTLHLLGYDHEEDGDAEIMEALEIKILAELQIDNPY